MRVFLGICLIAVPILFVFFVLASTQIGGVPQRGDATFLMLTIFGVPVTLGVYLLAGGSRIGKARHLGFGMAIFLLLIIAGGMAMSSPAHFDLDVVWKFLFVFGGVATGVLGLGYLRARA